MLLFEKQYCLVRNLHTRINKNSHVEHVSRRCLTAFSSLDIVENHIESCQKQQPTNNGFSYKDHLRFVDHYTKVEVLIIVHYHLQDNSKVLFKQISIAVGDYILTLIGNHYYSQFGLDCVKLFVKRTSFFGKDASKYLKTNVEL